MARLLENSFSNLLDEIASQRQLLAAEHNDLALDITTMAARQVLEEVAACYASTPSLADKRVVIDPGCPDLAFESDFTLVRRVLGNMLKNGLEASTAGQAVTLSCSAAPGEAVFQVHNHAVMPPEVQLQVFQRSFSTKGNGRGLGTYSIKLLSERYLGGRVSFTSAEGQGTTFTLQLPLKPARPDA
jgi:signal transduction histidine kinase